jgi:hypothetical protein
MLKTRNAAAALDAFVARKAEIDAMLDRLKALSDDHFNVAPEEINCGHVGTLAHYADLLKGITDAAFKEGEYAEWRIPLRFAPTGSPSGLGVVEGSRLARASLTRRTATMVKLSDSSSSSCPPPASATTTSCFRSPNGSRAAQRPRSSIASSPRAS